ncbi:serine protease SPPA, chloroplastic [Trifolium repens]|nr:serine protease SPPA, chloroplastic [Trifolium repens]
MFHRTVINRFRYIYKSRSTVLPPPPPPPRFLSFGPPIPTPKPFQFHFFSSYSSSSSSNAKDYPTGDFNLETLTSLNKFFVKLKTIIALPSEFVQDGSVLKINLQGRISDQLSRTLRDPDVLSLPQICDNFLKAAYDPRISAVYLCIHSLSCGWAKLDEIRRQISNFRKSGKMVVAYVPSILPKEYYIASACDEIFAPPLGVVGAAIPYDCVGNDEIHTSPYDCVGFGFHNLSYLSFVSCLYDNPYQNLYDYVEDNHYQALTPFVNNIYSNWLDKVSSSRGKKREEVENFINEGVYQVDKLKEHGFISSLVYDDDEVITLLKEKLGGVKSLPMISFRKYSKIRKWTVGISEAKEQVAIIRSPETMGSGIITNNFIKNIDMVKASKKFKAAIIRIDSLGGDVYASQSLWKAISSLASQKPVIASLSDVATGAGYYMAIGARVIVAENLTLTGSIRGTLSQNFYLDNRYENIYLEQDPHMCYFTPYDVDLYDVPPSISMALGRIHKMKNVEHGRIWIGKDAASHGLVDTIGGISCAIAIAKSEANIPQSRQVSAVELS